MSGQANNTPPFDHEGYKGNQLSGDLKKVYDAFFLEPSTMKEVDKRVGVMRESICRWVASLREMKLIYQIGIRRCTVTNHSKVGVYTTNPDLLPLEDPHLKIKGF